MLGENPNFEYSRVSPESMQVIPINFQKDGRDMLSKLYLMMHSGYIGIPKEHEDLITSLRTAKSENYLLDKQQTAHNDVFDALRLALKGFNIE